MGTIVDKLQAALDSKNAIKEKFNLPDDLPFSQYAENIEVEGEGSTVNTIEFYKCASLGSNTDNGDDSTNTIIYQVSNAGNTAANGGYYDSGETWSDGGDAYPILTNGTCFMRYSGLSMTWSIYDSYSDGTWGEELYYLEGESNPVSTNWVTMVGTDAGLTVTSGNTGTGTTTSTIATVNGAGTAEANGGYYDSGEVYTYVIDNSTYPIYTNGTCIMHFTPTSDSWIIFSDADKTKEDTDLYCASGTADTIPTSGWAISTSGVSPVPTVTLGGEDTPPLPANTWNGYKAVLVEETVTTEGETVVVVSGSGKEGVDGAYSLSNDKSEQEAIYTNAGGFYFKYDPTYMLWDVWGQNPVPVCESYGTSSGNPWDVTEWTTDMMNVNENMTVTQQTTEGTTENKKYYTFEETLTEGLTYGYGFTPEVGKVYDAEAMIQATLFESKPGIPTNGLVFYASLSEAKDTAETGQAVIDGSQSSFTEKDGIPCIYFNSSASSIKYKFDNTLNLGTTASQSIWFYDTTGNYPACISDYGNASDYHHYNHYNRHNQFSVGLQGGEVLAGNIQQNKWYHFVSVVNDNRVTIYINGEKLGDYDLNFDIKVDYAKFGDGIMSTNAGLTGYCAAARLYDRVLTEDEIQQLANEFEREGVTNA